MPWSGSAGVQTFTRATGVFAGATCWAQTDSAARGIRSDDHDAHDQDLADGITACINRSGGNTVAANIPMGGFKLTNLAPGTQPTDSVRYDQLPTGVLTTRGDLLYFGVSGQTRLPRGTTGYVLTQGANDPQWSVLPAPPTYGSAANYNIGTSGASVPMFIYGGTWTAAHSIQVSGQPGLAIWRMDISGTAFDTGWQQVQVFYLSNIHAGVISIKGSGFPGYPQGLTDYGTSSDIRLKHARREISDSGNIIDRLKPCYFRWGPEGKVPDDEGLEDFGLMAQEIHEILPGSVVPGTGSPGEEGFVPWMRQHGRLEAIAIAELKSLRARVARLEASLAAT